MADSLAATGLDAINVGRFDLTEGPQFLIDLRDKKKIPWLSANIVDARGQNLFPSSVIKNWGDKTAFIFSLTRPDAARDLAYGIAVEDPIAAARATVATAPADAVVICLSDLGYQAEHELLRQVGRINLVVGGGEGAKALANPVPIGSSLLLRACDRGRELGVFDYIAGPDKEWKTPVNLARAVEARRQIQTLKGNVAGKPGVSPSVETTFNELAAEADKMALPPGPKFVNRIITLDGTIGDDLEEARRIAAYNAQWPTSQKPSPQTAPAQSPAAQGQRPPGQQGAAAKGAATASAETPAAPPQRRSWLLDPGYSIGSNACKSCHEKAFKKWSGTGHSRSLIKLPKDKRRDPACQPCHTIEMKMQTRTARESVVGCEACHGRASAHPGEGKVRKVVDEAVCRACHKGEHGGKPLDFAEGYRKIRCDAE